MIDNLFYQLRDIEEEKCKMFSTYDLKKSNNSYAFLTLHRPSNVELAGNKKDTILHDYKTSINKKHKKFSVPPKWDGRAAERIWKIILSLSDSSTR